MSNIHSSTELIANLRITQKPDMAYPYAFGLAWSFLTELQREKLLEFVQQQVKDKGDN